MYQFIGKTVQNGDNPNSRGKVICETGIVIDKQKTYLSIQVDKDRTAKVCVYSSPDFLGRYTKVSGKGYIKIVEG
jgi:hypothetical protein